MRSLLPFILEYSESASHFHTRARSTHEKSVICLNNATLTVIYELVSGSYLKLLVLTLKMVRIRPKRFPAGTVNDLHAVVLDF